ncbi:amino acid ABC transporter permease [Polaromonas sp.]|jgi:polar amino acid transport system permease protein|uniref:amino acid ABC transporter permease n=1 Tax=Polaromonas sp. TaxID=1869339 RepID=UPI0037C6BA5A
MIEFNFVTVLEQWPMLLRGLGLTVALTAISAVLGVVLGTACAWARLHGGTVLKRVVSAYVEAVRNTPFIIQLFFIFFGLPSLGLRLSVEMASVLAMVLNLGAYACEIVRAGLQTTPKGQLEAAMSLALTPWQVFSRVVLPPALARIWPALVSQIIIVMLGSAVCGQISAEELSQAANLISSRTFRSFESYIIVTVVYLLLAIGVRQLLYWAGPRFLFVSR